MARHPAAHRVAGERFRDRGGRAIEVLQVTGLGDDRRGLRGTTVSESGRLVSQGTPVAACTTCAASSRQSSTSGARGTCPARGSGEEGRTFAWVSGVGIGTRLAIVGCQGRAAHRLVGKPRLEQYRWSHVSFGRPMLHQWSRARVLPHPLPHREALRWQLHPMREPRGGFRCALDSHWETSVRLAPRIT